MLNLRWVVFVAGYSTSSAATDTSKVKELHQFLLQSLIETKCGCIGIASAVLLLLVLALNVFPFGPWRFDAIPPDHRPKRQL